MSDYALLGALFLFFRSFTFNTNLYLLLILKCLPVLLTSYSTYQKNKVMGYGFLFCAIGDLFLQLDDTLHYDLYFIIGLISFLSVSPALQCKTCALKIDLVVGVI